MSKVDIRIPQIARMRVAGHKDAFIASVVGLTPAGLARIVSLPEYKDVENAVLSGTISKMDMALAGRADLLRQEFKVGVPLAMRTLLEAVQQRRDLRAALEASKELLDRDPDRVFVKASRSETAAQQSITIPGVVLTALAPSADSVATSSSATAKTLDANGTDVKKVNVPSTNVSTTVQ